jgi:hypothetical protein
VGAERAAEHGEHDGVQREPEPGASRGASFGGAVDLEDLGPHRVAGHDRARQWRALEGDGRRRREPADEAVGGGRHGVLLGEHERDAEKRRREGAGRGRVPSHGDDDRGTEAGQEHRRQHQTGGESCQRADVLEGEAAGDAAAREQRQREAGRRDERAVDAPPRTDEVDGVGRVAPSDQRLADGDGGHDVPGGAATGDHGPAPAHAGGAVPGAEVVLRLVRAGRRACRVTFRSMPTAAIIGTSDEPPEDTNGSGTPVIGNSPTTAPMLMTA